MANRSSGRDRSGTGRALAILGPLVDEAFAATTRAALTPMELTTVADDFAVVHDDFDVRVYDGLEPDHQYEYDGFAFRTLPRPPGERLSTFATVNDVHFGETDCGIIEGLDMGPIFRVQDGEEPYPDHDESRGHPRDGAARPRRRRRQG